MSTDNEREPVSLGDELAYMIASCFDDVGLMQDAIEQWFARRDIDVTFTPLDEPGMTKWRWVRHCVTRHPFTRTIRHANGVSVCTHGYYYEYPVS